MMQRTMSAISEGMERGLHVGAQVYVSLRGEVMADEAVGVAWPGRDGAAALPMTRDTITLWLSAGKPITAVAVARLWERGALELDDPVAKFVPEFAAHGKESVTLRHILTHTAPLRMVDTGWPNVSWAEVVRRICAARPEPRWISGRTAGYSLHVMWTVLGEVVRRVSGSPIERFVRDEVFGPCGMRNCFLAMTDEEIAANRDRLAVTQVTEKGTPVDYGTETDAALRVPRPGASARGPARELGKFYETLLAHGAGLISPQTVEAMTARHRVNTFDKTFQAVIDWGLGFIANSLMYGKEDAPYQYGPHASVRAFGHSGNQSSVGFADPEHQLAVAVVLNGMAGEAAHQARMRAILAAVYEDLGLAK
jgi:CubicO group peptidase (beta-lactamase class C family)